MKKEKLCSNIYEIDYISGKYEFIPIMIARLPHKCDHVGYENVGQLCAFWMRKGVKHEQSYSIPFQLHLRIDRDVGGLCPTADRA